MVLSFKDVILQRILVLPSRQVLVILFHPRLRPGLPSLRFVLPSRQRDVESTELSVAYLALIHLIIILVEVDFTIILFRTILGCIYKGCCSFACFTIFFA